MVKETSFDKNEKPKRWLIKKIAKKGKLVISD